jgi:hypothetical protein
MREHNPPTQTHMCIERTYLNSRTRQAAHNTTRENTTHQLIPYAHRGKLYINNISNKRKQQFPRPIILTPDDDHIGQSM